MRTWTTLLVATLLSACSLVLDGSDLTGGAADSGSRPDTGVDLDAGPDVDAGDPCDRDGDGFENGESGCGEGLRDCDDDNATVSPGASEVCGDGLVNDCAQRGPGTLASRLGTDVELGSWIPEEAGPFVAPLSAALVTAAGGDPILAILVARAGGTHGATMVMGPLDRPLDRAALTGCNFPESLVDLVPGVDGVVHGHVVLSGSTSAGTILSQQFTAEWSPEVVGGVAISDSRCAAASVPFLTHGAAVFQTEDGQVSGIYGQSGDACFSFDGTCSTTTAGTAVGTSARAGGMMFGVVASTGPDYQVIAANTSTGAPAAWSDLTFPSEWPPLGASRSVRPAAAHFGDRLVLVVPRLEDLQVFDTVCTSSACVDAAPPASTTIESRMPRSIALAPYSGGRFVMAHEEANLVQLAVLTSSSLGEDFPLPGLPSADVLDLGIADVIVGTRHIFTVVALVAEGSGSRLHRRTFETCATP